MSQLPTNSYKSIPANLLVTQLPWRRGHIHTEETVTDPPTPPPPHKLVGHQLAVFKYQIHINVCDIRQAWGTAWSG